MCLGFWIENWYTLKGVPTWRKMEKPITTAFHRRRLPHWSVLNREYFVTFRLHGTIPAHVISELRARREKLRMAPHEEIIQNQRIEFLKIESVLDNANNNRAFLSVPDIAKLVLSKFDEMEIVYLWRFTNIVIMPNHVHCLCCDSDKAIAPLGKVLGELKGSTAYQANKMLSRSGKFWATENFDHWCRNPLRVESVKKYIMDNPVKARLVLKPEEWPWRKPK
jgi:REP element-mobilizing transposase RayT